MADSPSVLDYQSDLAASHINLGTVLQKTRHHAEAEQAYRQAITLGEKLAAESPSVLQYRGDLAASLANLGNLLRMTGQQSEAELAYRRTITLGEKLAAASPSVAKYRSALAWSRKDMGDLMAQTGRPAEAEQAYRQAIALFEKLVLESPSVPDYQNGQAGSNVRLATLLQAASRGVEAEQRYHQAIALAENITDPETQNELSWALAASPKRGTHDFQLALQLAKKAVEHEPQDGGFWNTLGVAHYRVGDWKEAIEALEKSMQLRAGGDPADWFFLAMACWQKGDKGKAHSWYDKAAQSMEKNKSQDDELRRFRDEAAVLLGVADQPKSTGKEEETPKQHTRP